MVNAESKIVIVGAHEFKFVPPDELHFSLCGEFTEIDSIDYIHFIFRHKKVNNGKLFAFYDFTKLTRVAEGARKRVIEVSEPYPFVALAIVPGSLSNRVLVSMLMRAGRIIAPQNLTFAYEFVSTIEEANVWFNKLREENA